MLVCVLHPVVLIPAMAEGGDVDWELSKENIQPLKRGRAISALHQALSQQQDGLSSAINQQKQYELRQCTLIGQKQLFSTTKHFSTRFCNFFCL